MKIIKETIDNKDIWFIVDECYSLENSNFLGYVSYFNTVEPKLLLGESVKNANHKMLTFKTKDIAFEEAKKYYLANKK